MTIKEVSEDIRSYTYTFNAPGVTTNANATEYRTIFNIYDSNDFYSYPLPFAEESFYRYGRDITAVIADSDEIKAEIARLKGRDDYISLDAETTLKYMHLFGQRFPDRSSLYETVNVTQVYDTEEEANSRAEQCLSLIGSEEGLGLEGLCSIDCRETNGMFEVSMDYCGGAVLISYAKALAYGQSAGEAAMQLFEEDAAACEILELLMDHAAELTGGHLLINSLVLSGFGI